MLLFYTLPLKLFYCINTVQMNSLWLPNSGKRLNYPVVPAPLYYCFFFQHQKQHTFNHNYLAEVHAQSYQRYIFQVTLKHILGIKLYEGFIHTSDLLGVNYCTNYSVHRIPIKWVHNPLLPIAYEVWGKVMFSQACLILDAPRPEDAPLHQMHPLQRMHPSSPKDRRSTGGLYASYWNAYFYLVELFSPWM